MAARKCCVSSIKTQSSGLRVADVQSSGFSTYPLIALSFYLGNTLLPIQLLYRNSLFSTPRRLSMTERKLWEEQQICIKTSRGKILLPDIADGPSVGPGAGTVSCCILAPPSSGGRHQYIILGERANNYNIIITLLRHAAATQICKHTHKIYYRGNEKLIFQ